MKVPVEINVDTKTKDFTISVSSPPVSELLKKELSLDKASGTPGTVKVGNMAIEQIISVAKTKMPDLLAKDLKAAVKLVAGNCVSLGILIDNKDGKQICEEIDTGRYDKEIESESTEVSPEKKAKLDKFFAAVKAKQEKDKKALEEAEKAAEEAKAAAAAEAAPAEGVPAEAKVEGEPEEANAEEKKEENKEEKK